MSTRINVVSFRDEDVSAAIGDLVTMFPDPFIVFAMTEDLVFYDSMMSVINKHQVKYHAFYSSDLELPEVTGKLGTFTSAPDPTKEVIKQVEAHDIFAIAWDDSLECHEALHSVEDYGVDAWNILGELELIIVDDEDEEPEEALLEVIQDAIGDIVELMSTYIAAKVMRVLHETAEDMHTEGWHPAQYADEDDEDFEE